MTSRDPEFLPLWLLSLMTATFFFSLAAAPHCTLINKLYTICLIGFHWHILLTYVAFHYVWIKLRSWIITCFNVYFDICHVPFSLAFFCLSFFLCRPTLFSFQFHVIAIATLACNLLGHHWSKLAGRCTSLWERRKLLAKGVRNTPPLCTFIFTAGSVFLV